MQLSHGGRSSVGRAPGCGPGGRGFESHRSPLSAVPSQRRLIATIAGSVVAVDAVTKAVAASALAGRGVVNVFGGAFHLELYRNFAGPGNILTGHPVLVSLLSLIAVALIAVVAWSVRSTGYAVAIGLLLGGGVGNLLDRLLRAPGPLRGGVVDWIKPTLSSGSLNVADLSINAAILAMLVAVGLDAYRQRRASGGAASGPSNGPA